MKKLLITNLVFIGILICTTSRHISAQKKDCEVLEPEAIVGTYTGECRRGKAHGKGKSVGKDTYEGEFKRGRPHGFGKYTWKNGNYFEGEFNKGEKNGKGKLVKNNEDDEEIVITGYWLDNEYIGKSKHPYKITYKSSNINNIRFMRIPGEVHELRFKFDYSYGGRKMDGSDEFERPESKSTGENFQLTSDFPIGEITTEGAYRVVKDIKYPFKGKCKASGVEFDFEISQAGTWEITVQMVVDDID